MKCRHCETELTLPLVDLGSAPPSNAYLTEHSLRMPEKWFPLRVLVCDNCWLVQTEDFAQADELFDDDYAYFSSFSDGWLAHAERYVSDMVARIGLTGDSHVIEVAANDGYLLQYVQQKGIPCTGIEPTASTAAAARDKGIAVIERFFGVALADELVAAGQQADLTVANNVLAHVPDINDFTAGFSALLKPNGVATFEFPHLMRLIEGTQFDTIYHEHFSYLSLSAVDRIFKANGLVVFDVEELPTHGGSLRVFAQRADAGEWPRTEAVGEMLRRETERGLTSATGYLDFQTRSDAVKDGFLRFLLEARREGKKVAAYGAAAKGNTLLNYAGVRPDLLPYVVDRNPAKQGKYLPGSRIPVVDERYLREMRPDRILILPWNLKQEVMQQLDYVRDWDAQFVTAVPELDIA
jgi:2-polyprenyl-3-methyl-5-hydroxy-6-metoxy-1,4-benzoquinol methylase